MPWTAENFPVLNERALAFQQVFDEAISPKYDCVPSTPPALVYDPYMMEVVHDGRQRDGKSQENVDS